jgi:hypothetical protein
MKYPAMDVEEAGVSRSEGGDMNPGHTREERQKLREEM